ncbi:hypothetical protein CH63R_12503 [Colletotrichum higginsianum IMI 349063]|uniref:Uncharacterized protein n=1 Tax=Colletotrichum higginsianum (strain IMI 349063) TaxID=759273 RepID=A0A1B7XUE3_COLHI|nr:hypothetical protein CH63R_12503 [Colletotrichum higginsianum IMI 349063]OBR03376.1 hypothetical protein CH63R_12503 [Colletotrichum higginsianum IMI 349063]
MRVTQPEVPVARDSEAAKQAGRRLFFNEVPETPSKASRRGRRPQRRVLNAEIKIIPSLIWGPSSTSSNSTEETRDTEAKLRNTLLGQPTYTDWGFWARPSGGGERAITATGHGRAGQGRQGSRADQEEKGSSGLTREFVLQVIGTLPQHRERPTLEPSWGWLSTSSWMPIPLASEGCPAGNQQQGKRRGVGGKATNPTKGFGLVSRGQQGYVGVLATEVWITTMVDGGSKPSFGGTGELPLVLVVINQQATPAEDGAISSLFSNMPFSIFPLGAGAAGAGAGLEPSRDAAGLERPGKPW